MASVTAAPALFDVRAVSVALGLSERLVRDRAAAGVLPALRLGGAWRFDPLEVAAAVAGESATADRIADAIRRAGSPGEGRA